MSTQLDNLLKAFRDLPYQDMMKVADVVAAQLGDKRADNQYRVAEALASLRPLMVSPTEKSEEEKVLREALGRRKRSVLITPLEKGWRVELANDVVSGGSQTQSPELRVAFGQMIDQIITAHLMLK